MSRGIQTRKDVVSAIRIRLEAALRDCDYCSGSFEEGDEFVALMLEARIAVREAVLRVGEAEGMMPE